MICDEDCGSLITIGKKIKPDPLGTLLTCKGSGSAFAGMCRAPGGTNGCPLNIIEMRFNSRSMGSETQ